jgi:hypothetical protein
MGGISTGTNTPTIPLDQLEAAKRDYIAKRYPGRPSSYNTEIASIILTRLSQGEVITKICEDPDLPCFSTFYDWKREIPDFAQAVKRAQAAHDESRVAAAAAGLDAVDGTARDNQVRKAECIARFTLDLAARRSFKEFGEKKQNLNVNINSDVAPVDLSAWLNK